MPLTTCGRPPRGVDMKQLWLTGPSPFSVTGNTIRRNSSEQFAQNGPQSLGRRAREVYLHFCRMDGAGALHAAAGRVPWRQRTEMAEATADTAVQVLVRMGNPCPAVLPPAKRCRRICWGRKHAGCGFFHRQPYSTPPATDCLRTTCLGPPEALPVQSSCWRRTLITGPSWDRFSG